MEIAAQFSSLPRGRFGEGHASVGDHAGHDLCHGVDGDVARVDSCLDCTVQQTSDVPVGVFVFTFPPPRPPHSDRTFHIDQSANNRIDTLAVPR